ncbi:MAG: UDP-glucose/GDP-mannose dehydrogenase family protein [Candidatus Eisenbacteria sp.]|nr:UDP-glucose/GDP-mannose dehydrogenase family protein [Candidatus Eisenbacteria bacterium]
MHNVSVMGTGYVGLVTGACLADFGNQVINVDVDEKKIESLKRFEVPFFEPGLAEFVRINAQRGRLKFTTEVEGAIRDSEVIFIAVGTPSTYEGDADLSQVEEVARSIGRAMNGYKVVVSKSTVPCGTGGLVEGWIRDSQKEPIEFDVVSNPEFLREGSAIEDFMKPDRIVIGAANERATNVLAEIYRPLTLLGVPLVRTTVRSAEMIKYASNAFLATKISFVNEMAGICESLGADVTVVAKAMGLDSRIGSKFLQAGAGYGGSCFPKDVRALIQAAESHGARAEIVKAVMRVNDRQKQRMIEKVATVLGNPRGKRVAVLGLAFKPQTDDMREAPSLTLIRGLRDLGVDIVAFDPEAMEESRKILPDLETAADPYEAGKDADCVVLVTDWNEFRELDLGRMKEQMRTPALVDCRNVYEPESVRALGFRYASVGRP